MFDLFDSRTPMRKLRSVAEIRRREHIFDFAVGMAMIASIIVTSWWAVR